jgi:hypothetical protein
MTHEDKQFAVEIAQRFIEMQEEIRSLRAVLGVFWRQQTPFEAFVQKGIRQLQARERGAEGFQYLEPAFHAASDGGALMRILHQQTIGRVNIPD